MSQYKIDEFITSQPSGYYYETSGSDSYSKIYNHSESMKRNSKQQDNPYYSPLYDSDQNYSFTIQKDNKHSENYEPTSVLHNFASTESILSSKSEANDHIDRFIIESIVKELLGAKDSHKKEIDSKPTDIEKYQQNLEESHNKAINDLNEKDNEPIKVYNYDETTSKKMQKKLQHLKKELDHSYENTSNDGFTSKAKDLLDEKEPVTKEEEEVEVQPTPVMRNNVTKSPLKKRKSALIRTKTRSIIDMIEQKTEAVKEKFHEKIHKEPCEEQVKESSAEIQTTEIIKTTSKDEQTESFAYKNIIVSSVVDKTEDNSPKDLEEENKKTQQETEKPHEEIKNPTIREAFNIIAKSVKEPFNNSSSDNDSFKEIKDNKTSIVLDKEALTLTSKDKETKPEEPTSKNLSFHSIDEPVNQEVKSQTLKSNSELKIENEKLDEEIKQLDKEIEKKIKSIQNSTISSLKSEKKKANNEPVVKPVVAQVDQNKRNSMFPRLNTFKEKILNKANDINESKKKDANQQDEAKSGKSYIQPGVYGYLVTNKSTTTTTTADHLNSSYNNDNSSSVLSANTSPKKAEEPKTSNFRNSMIVLKTKIQDEKDDMKHKYSETKHKMVKKSKDKRKSKKKRKSQAPTIQHLVQPFIPNESETKINEEENMLGVQLNPEQKAHLADMDIKTEIKRASIESSESSESLKFVEVVSKNQIDLEEQPKIINAELPPKLTLKKNEWKHREDSNTDSEDYKVPVNTKLPTEELKTLNESGKSKEVVGSRNSNLLDRILLIDPKSPKVEDSMFFSESESLTHPSTSHKPSTQHQFDQVDEINDDEEDIDEVFRKEKEILKSKENGIDIIEDNEEPKTLKKDKIPSITLTKPDGSMSTIDPESEERLQKLAKIEVNNDEKDNSEEILKIHNKFKKDPTTLTPPNENIDLNEIKTHDQSTSKKDLLRRLSTKTDTKLDSGKLKAKNRWVKLKQNIHRKEKK